MIRLTVNDKTYYINVNLTTLFTVELLSDNDGEYKVLTVNDLEFDERTSEGLHDALNILEGLTLKIQPISPIFQPSLGGKSH